MLRDFVFVPHSTFLQVEDVFLFQIIETTGLPHQTETVHGNRVKATGGAVAERTESHYDHAHPTVSEPSEPSEEEAQCSSLEPRRELSRENIRQWWGSMRNRLNSQTSVSGDVSGDANVEGAETDGECRAQ